MLSGFFSSSETALTSFKSSDLEEVEKKGKGKAELLKKWLKSPNEMLTAMLLGNNIVNILASSIATALAIGLFGNSPQILAVVTAAMTVLILIFGEITPKVVAKNNSRLIASMVIRPIYYFGVLMKPAIKILMWMSVFVGRIFGIEVKNEGMMITEEDIKSFVNVGEAEGIIEEEEKEMIHSIVGFGETMAREVMTPRTSVFAIEGNKTVNDVWDEMMEAGFSRIPVYDETIDNIIGVLYIKDVLNKLKDKGFDIKVKDLVRESYFVPETKSIIQILQEFKSKKVHMALVLDEYGGIAGVLTIEDLLEEIVGEIRDEFDHEEDELIKEIEPNRFIMDAALDIETINKELEIEIPESEDYESIGGYIMAELGKIPEVGEKVERDNIVITVILADKKKVSKVEIRKGEQEE